MFLICRCARQKHVLLELLRMDYQIHAPHAKLTAPLVPPPTPVLLVSLGSLFKVVFVFPVLSDVQLALVRQSALHAQILRRQL